MPGNLLMGYGTSNQTVTITLGSLANSSARQSVYIDNTANLYDDYLIFAKLKSGGSGVLATGSAGIYVAASVDGGTTYADGANGTDAAITLTVPPNALLIGYLNMVANATTYYGGPFSVARVFGGVVPARFSIIVDNRTAAALDATNGNHAITYQGVYFTYT